MTNNLENKTTQNNHNEIVTEILLHNEKFVENKEYDKFTTDKYPDKHVAVLACMDTRLTQLLPEALGMKNGDMKLIKNAGGVITHPCDSVMRSLLVAIYDLKVDTILVIGHEDCGAQNLNTESILEKMRSRGIKEETLNTMDYLVPFSQWLCGFSCVDESVKNTVNQVKNHPLVPNDVCVYGFVMNPNTGKLREIL